MKFLIESDRVIAELSSNQLVISTTPGIGVRPYELFLSSLIGCGGTLLRTILEKKRVPYEKLEMQADSIRNPSHANRIERISINATIFSKEEMPLAQREKISSLIIKNCGMIQSVLPAIKVDVSINIIHEDEESE
ncbi:OsmC family protein [Sutcliffiella horikoshii]|uniref:OsmC family protein n=1 Tax=Sutcliffiella horikoshii TaxID=79883 RepID=UPI001F17CAA8|nr:OsmC family protein [Sutcliffiella horikoshii]MCG1023413.1 OsmC family peroxiredoxin [Sutcliffiella horikoshii]